TQEAPLNRSDAAQHEYSRYRRERICRDGDAERPEAELLALRPTSTHPEREGTEQQPEAHVADHQTEVEREEHRQRPTRVEGAVLRGREERQKTLERPDPGGVVELHRHAAVVMLVGGSPGGRDAVAELALEATENTLSLIGRDPALQGEGVAALEQILGRGVTVADVLRLLIHLGETSAVLACELFELRSDRSEALGNRLRALFHDMCGLRDAGLRVAIRQA